MTLRGLGKIPVYKLSLWALLCICMNLMTTHGTPFQNIHRPISGLSESFLPCYMVLLDLPIIAL